MSISERKGKGIVCEREQQSRKREKKERKKRGFPTCSEVSIEEKRRVVSQPVEGDREWSGFSGKQHLEAAKQRLLIRK